MKPGQVFSRAGFQHFDRVDRVDVNQVAAGNGTAAVLRTPAKRLPFSQITLISAR